MVRRQPTNVAFPSKEPQRGILLKGSTLPASMSRHNSTGPRISSHENLTFYPDEGASTGAFEAARVSVLSLADTAEVNPRKQFKIRKFKVRKGLGQREIVTGEIEESQAIKVARK